MPNSLVDRVNDRIDDSLLERLSDALAIDGSRTPILMSAAVPGLLSAFSLAAHREGGAQAVLAAAAQQDVGPVNELQLSLSSDAGTALAERGSELLDRLIGADPAQGLVDAFARFCDVEATRSRATLGLLAPLVLDTLARAATDPRTAPDAATLQSMLLEQRNAIDTAMPAAFSDELQMRGVFASPGPVPSTDPVGDPVGDSVAGPLPPVATPPASAASPSGWRQTLGWLLPLLLLVALAFAGMRYVSARVDAGLSDVEPTATDTLER